MPNVSPSTLRNLADLSKVCLFPRVADDGTATAAALDLDGAQHRALVGAAYLHSSCGARTADTLAHGAEYEPHPLGILTWWPDLHVSDSSGPDVHLSAFGWSDILGYNAGVYYTDTPDGPRLATTDPSHIGRTTTALLNADPGRLRAATTVVHHPADGPRPDHYVWPHVVAPREEDL